MEISNPVWCRAVFWKSFFFLLPIFSNLKILPNTVLDLLLGLIAVFVLPRPIRKDLLFLVMSWMSVTYFRGLFLEPTGSDAFLSCLRYLLVGGIVVCLNGKIALNQETARYYIAGTIVLVALFAGASWTGNHFKWEYMWMQKWLLCGPSFLSFTVITGFSLSLIFWRDYPKTFVGMLGITLFIPPIMESRILEWFSFLIIGFSVIPILFFLKKNRLLFILSSVAIFISMFFLTPALKAVGLFPSSIEKRQTNPVLKVKERIKHDLVSVEFDQDRKSQIKKIFQVREWPEDLIGRGGMQHQINEGAKNDFRPGSITRPIGGLIQKNDGGILLVFFTFVLFLTSLARLLITVSCHPSWKAIYLIFFMTGSYSFLFLTNPTGSLQWWLFIAPHGFLHNLIFQASAFKITSTRNT